MAKTPEGIATDDVLIGASSCGMRVMRNNNGAMQDHTGRVVRYGLGNESKKLNQEMAFGDQVGLTPITITADMVGKKVAVFTMLEVKPPAKLEASIKRAMTVKDSREAAQLRAIHWVVNNGGIANFVSCQADTKATYEYYLSELKK